MKTIYKIALLSLFAFVLLASSTNNSCPDTEAGIIFEDNKLARSWYPGISAISVTDDSNWSGIASAGDGSPGNPWIIENFMIECNGSGNGIWVQDTRDHVIFRNFYVNESTPGSGYGVGMQNCSNIQIINCTAEANYAAIFILNSTFISVNSSLLRDNEINFGADNIINCTVGSTLFTNTSATYANLFVISLLTGQISEDVLVENCTFRNNVTSGITVQEAQRMSFRNCNFLNGTGMSLVDTNDFLVINSIFHTHTTPIRLLGTNNTRFFNCSFNDGNYDAVDGFYSTLDDDYIWIENCTFRGFITSISVNDGNHFLVNNCTFDLMNWGSAFFIQDMNNVVVSNCHVYNATSTTDVIYSQGTQYNHSYINNSISRMAFNDIVNLEITGNYFTGAGTVIVIDSISNFMIDNNLIWVLNSNNPITNGNITNNHFNSGGFTLYTCTGILVENNTFTSGSGISAYSITGTINNNTFISTSRAVHVSGGGSNIIVTRNTIVGTTVIAIAIEFANTRVLIAENSILNYNGGGIYLYSTNDANITHNTITGMRANTGTAAFGIEAYGLNISINANSIETFRKRYVNDISGYGIVVGLINSSIRSNVVNQIPSGIYLTNWVSTGQNISVLGNYIIGSASAALTLRGIQTSITITGNFLYQSTRGLYFSGVVPYTYITNTSITGNLFKGNSAFFQNDTALTNTVLVTRNYYYEYFVIYPYDVFLNFTTIELARDIVLAPRVTDYHPLFYQPWYAWARDLYLYYFSTIDYFGLDFMLVKTFIDGEQISDNTISFNKQIFRLTIKDFADVVLYDKLHNYNTTKHVIIGLPVADILFFNNYSVDIIVYFTRSGRTTTFTLKANSGIQIRFAMGDYSYVVTDLDGNELEASNQYSIVATDPSTFSLTFGKVSVIPPPFVSSIFSLVIAVVLVLGILGGTLVIAMIYNREPKTRTSRYID